MSYIDLHMHTINSDGILTPEELISRAHKYVSHLAITDHNRLLPNISEVRDMFPDIEITSGSEISANYYTKNNKKIEIHIVGLFLEHTEELKHFLSLNWTNGKDRIENMIKKLLVCGVDLECNTYDEFCSMYYPDREVIGRPQLAEIIVKKGYSVSVDDALDTYIGEYGLRLAYAPNTHTFFDLGLVIESIHNAGGVAVLAHPLSYQLTDDELMDLINHFKHLNGDGMEVWYSRYDSEKRSCLAALADEHHLLQSCGSDYHGNREGECLDNKFSVMYLELLRQRHLLYSKDN